MQNNFPISPRILLCNDDGIYAPGLESLYKIASALSEDIWIVAPESEQSGASHSLSLRHPLRIRELGPKRYAVNGTPTDCVLIALRHLMKDERPHLVLSGVNNGSNLAEDITYSGTVAAAMEATLFGIPAVAMSLEINDNPPQWDTAEYFGPEVLQRVLNYSWPSNVLLNINFPDASVNDVNGVRVTFQGQRQMAQTLLKTLDPRGRPYYWVGSPKDDDLGHPDTDLSALRQKGITVTPVYMNLTHVPSLLELSDCFADFKG